MSQDPEANEGVLARLWDCGSRNVWGSRARWRPLELICWGRWLDLFMGNLGLGLVLEAK